MAADPTIDDLEKQHKSELASILVSWDFYYAGMQKFRDEGLRAANPKVQNLYKLAIDTFIPETAEWINHQVKYEIGNPSIPFSGLTGSQKIMLPGGDSPALMNPHIMNDFIDKAIYFSKIRPVLVKYVANTK